MAFIPVHDGKALSHIAWPYVTWGLIAVNVLVFVFGQAGGFSQASEASVISFGLIPAVFNDYRDLADYGEVHEHLTLLTYAFFHGDFWHLVGNMVFLYVFADNVEDALGHVRFLVFYLLCALVAGYAYVLSAPQSLDPVIGASGAVAGVIAAYFMLYPAQKVWVLFFGRIPLRLNALWVLGAWIVLQVYSVIAAGPEEQVAWWTHIGGLIAGAVLVVFMRRPGVPLFDRSAPMAIGAKPPMVDDARSPP